MRTISLSRGKVALVDNEDFDRLNKHKWSARKHGNTFYAVRNLPRVRGEGRRMEYMHRVILNPPFEIDHIDGNGLNNQRPNLHAVTRRQNCQNLHIKKTSRFPGVRWDKISKKWRTDVRINGRKKYLGSFLVEEEAFIVYRKAVNKIEEG